MAQKKFIIDGGFQTSDDSVIAANLEMSGHILPSVDSDGTTGYDLGSTTKKWRDLFLSEGSLYINNQKVIEDSSGTIIVRADEDQSLTMKTEGTGVLTLQSAQTVNFAGTLQMASGKKITDAGGSAVGFGDKIDMDSNKIINVGTPTDNTDAANKSYVDGLIGNIATDAISEGDTELEIADLGTGTVGITVDGTQRFALTGTSLALTVPITVNGDTMAKEDYVDTEIATATTSLQGYADQAEADAKTYADAAVANLVNSAPAALDTLNELAAALGDDANFATTVTNNIATAKSEAMAYTDSEIAALDFNNVAGGIAVTGGAVSLGANADLELSGSSEVSYSGSTIVGDDPDNAGNPAVCASSFRPTAGTANLSLRPNAGGAIDLDGGDVAYGGVGIVGDDPSNAGQPTVCASTFRPVSGQADLNLAPGTGGAIALSSDGDVTYGGSGIVGDDPDNAGEPTLCASTFRPVSGVTDLNLRPGTGGAITLGGAKIQGVSDPAADTDAANKGYADAREAAAVATAATDATTKADAAEAAAVATAAADATSKANTAQSNAEATAAAALATAIAGIEAQISTSAFHSAVTDVTNASTLAYTFTDLIGAEDYTVYVNRLLVRPAELTSVNLTTGEVTFASSVVEVGDEIEVKGWKLVE